MAIPDRPRPTRPRVRPRRHAGLLVAAMALWALPSLAAPQPASAAAGGQASDVTLNVAGTTVVAGGASFGAVGPYEKVTGSLTVALDPGDPRNAVITDLSLAPRDARGRVDYTAQFLMLRPVDLARGNGELLYEVNNRGNLLGLSAFDDAPFGNNPTTAADLGNGFLMERGYTYLSVGWQGDLVPSANVLSVQFPVATAAGGKAITQRIAVEYTDDLSFKTDGSTTTLPLSGSPSFRSYPAVASATPTAQLWVRPSDSPRPNGVVVPRGELVPRSAWSFTSPTEISLPGGFRPGMVYELDYVASDPTVLGLAYATTRDAVSFFRYAATDAHGTPNPVAGLRHALAWGASQSGAYLRDYLYQGFNQDLSGRKVFDGVSVHIAGALKGQGENYRFGQLNPWADQHRGRLQPGLGFPFTYGVRTNPLVRAHRTAGPLRDGILKRPATDPVVIQTDSSAEYWWAAAALVDTDGSGHDVALPANARHYLISGTQHFVGVGAQPSLDVCQQLNNPTRQAPALRALLVALDQWATAGMQPPASQAPTFRSRTLAVPTPRAASIGFPRIPGVTYTGVVHVAGERSDGPQVHGNGGVLRNWTQPFFVHTYVTPVPRTDRVGIDLGGVRVPQVGVPTATLTGWNLRRAPFTAGDLCGLNGMDVPLQPTTQQTRLTGDSRPSLQQLYPTHARYVADVTAFVAQQERRRLLLPADGRQAVADARTSTVP